MYYERDIRRGPVADITEERFFISAYGQAVLLLKRIDGNDTWRALHRDNLGSLIAVTDATGRLVEELSYEAYGNRRNLDGTSDAEMRLAAQTTDRGYTGHEHLDEVDLIHMNGRVYDPLLGRFLSADPYVQDAYDLQSYNRYSYVRNNPLLYTDPSGYSWLSDFWRSIGRPFAAIWVMTIIGPAAYNLGFGLAGGAVAGATNSIAAGIVAGTIGGGVFAGVLTQVATTGRPNGWEHAGISAMMFNWAGEFGTELSGQRMLSHAVAGCGSGQLRGGNCSSGGLSAGFAQFATGRIPGGWEPAAKMAAAMTVGGTASVLAGSSFANGARTAAFGYLFNDMAHEMSPDGAFRSEGDTAYPQDAKQWFDHTVDFAEGAATTVGVALAPAAVAGGAEALAAGRVGQFSDYFRWGRTTISNQLVEGPGATGAIRGWAIKGGGTNPQTGFSLPFHYHIHRYNWYQPLEWFKQTPIIKQ